MELVELLDTNESFLKIRGRELENEGAFSFLTAYEHACLYLHVYTNPNWEKDPVTTALIVAQEWRMECNTLASANAYQVEFYSWMPSIDLYPKIGLPPMLKPNRNMVLNGFF